MEDKCQDFQAGVDISGQDELDGDYLKKNILTTYHPTQVNVPRLTPARKTDID